MMVVLPSLAGFNEEIFWTVYEVLGRIINAAKGVVQLWFASQCPTWFYLYYSEEGGFVVAMGGYPIEWEYLINSFYSSGSTHVWNTGRNALNWFLEHLPCIASTIHPSRTTYLTRANRAIPTPRLGSPWKSARLKLNHRISNTLRRKMLNHRSFLGGGRGGIAPPSTLPMSLSMYIIKLSFDCNFFILQFNSTYWFL